LWEEDCSDIPGDKVANDNVAAIALSVKEDEWRKNIAVPVWKSGADRIKLVEETETDDSL